MDQKMILTVWKAAGKALLRASDGFWRGFVGRPGVGKTTAIREISRLLAEDLARRVVIVDTSNEIGGDGDIPHPAIGRARRMQVCLTYMHVLSMASMVPWLHAPLACMFLAHMHVLFSKFAAVWEGGTKNMQACR